MTYHFMFVVFDLASSLVHPDPRPRVEGSHDVGHPITFFLSGLTPGDPHIHFHEIFQHPTPTYYSNRFTELAAKLGPSIAATYRSLRVVEENVIDDGLNQVSQLASFHDRDAVSVFMLHNRPIVSRVVAALDAALAIFSPNTEIELDVSVEPDSGMNSLVAYLITDIEISEAFDLLDVLNRDFTRKQTRDFRDLFHFMIAPR